MLTVRMTAADAAVSGQGWCSQAIRSVSGRKSSGRAEAASISRIELAAASWGWSVWGAAVVWMAVPNTTRPNRAGASWGPAVGERLSRRFGDVERPCRGGGGDHDEQRSVEQTGGWADR